MNHRFEPSMAQRGMMFAVMAEYKPPTIQIADVTHPPTNWTISGGEFGPISLPLTPCPECGGVAITIVFDPEDETGPTTLCDGCGVCR